VLRTLQNLYKLDVCAQREQGDLNHINTSKMALRKHHKLLQSCESQDTNSASNTFLRNLFWESLLPVQPTYSAKAMNCLRIYTDKLVRAGSQLSILLFPPNPLTVLVKRPRNPLLFHIQLPDH